MEIILDKELEALVEEQVARGKYQNASEVVAEGLRMLFQQRLVEQHVDLDRWRTQIAEGLEQANRGEVFDAEEIFRQLEDKVRPEGDPVAQVFGCLKLDKTTDEIMAELRGEP